jgi:hypothetical protein
MPKLTIEIYDDHWEQIRAGARRGNLDPEEFIRIAALRAAEAHTVGSIPGFPEDDGEHDGLAFLESVEPPPKPADALQALIRGYAIGSDAQI